MVGYRDLDPSAEAVLTGGVFASPSDPRTTPAHITGLAFHSPRISRTSPPSASPSVPAAGNRVVAELDTLQETHSGSEKGRASPVSEGTFFPWCISTKSENASWGFSAETAWKSIPGTWFIGVDGGSTTTKAAVLDLETGSLLDGIYLATAGDPEGALLEVFRHLEKNRRGVSVAGVCTTGSARKLYERMLLSRSRRESALAEG